MKILIVGGGLAGLYHAYKLSTQNHDITILEKQSYLGGQLKTIKYLKNGLSFYFDVGPHIPPIYHKIWNYFCSKVDHISVPLPIRVSIKLKQHIDLIFPPDLGIIRSIRPLDLLMLSKYLPFYIFSSIYKKKEKNLEDSLINSWGIQFYKDYIFNFISTFWKTHPSIISKEYKTRFTPPKLSYTIRKIMESFYFSNKSQVPNKIFLYPKQGVGKVIDFLESDILKRGVVIKKNCKINLLRFNQESSQIEYKQESKVFKEEFEQIYWAASINDLINILGLRNYNNLIYRKLLTINLSINRKSLFQPQVHAAYIMIPNIIFHRIYEPKKLSPFMVPEHKTSACLEITLKNSKYNEDKITSLALNQFKSLYNLKEHEINHLGNFYYEEAYPFLFNYYKNQYRELINEVKTNFSSFYFIGRTGQFFPYTINQTLDSVENYF